MKTLQQRVRRVQAKLAPPPPPREGLLRVDEDHWDTWLTTLFRPYFCDVTGQLIPFAPHHRQCWEWVWSLERGKRPQPFIAIWPRGGGKSTTAELACVALGAKRSRTYGLYISATQGQADGHVANVASLLESEAIAQHSPSLANRLLGKYGHSRGWRRNRLRTSEGFTIDAVGFDTAVRGVKIDADRPDFLVLDDLDQDTDSAGSVAKKITALTRKILPAGSADVAILGVQNLVHPDGIFARLLDGRAEFLRTRILSGPVPALRGLMYEEQDGQTILTAGEPTWAGQDLAQCQALVNDATMGAFLAECQHVRLHGEGAMFGDVWQDGVHIVEPFAIPQTWTVRRSFDWGSSAPFSVGWWALSNGEALPDGRWWPRGTRFRVAEWYGWNGKPNEGLRLVATEIARRIETYEAEFAFAVRPGPADTNIFDVVNGVCIADDMSRVGVRWEKADKKPGSRRQGVQQMRERLQASCRRPMDAPGLFVFSTCAQFLRVIPTLPRDCLDQEDIDSAAEDH